MSTGKTIALIIWNFVGKVMSLLFNMLSRLVIPFLPRSKRLLTSWLQSPSVITISEKAMAPHSSTLAWKILWMEEPDRLYSPWVCKELDMAKQLHFHFHALEKKWQPTPVFLPGESQGRGSLVGCRPWGHTESDTTEVT